MITIRDLVSEYCMAKVFRDTLYELKLDGALGTMLYDHILNNIAYRKVDHKFIQRVAALESLIRTSIADSIAQVSTAELNVEDIVCDVERRLRDKEILE